MIDEKSYKDPCDEQGGDTGVVASGTSAEPENEAAVGADVVDDLCSDRQAHI